MSGVDITLANGQLGATTQTDDGVCGMVLTGGIDDLGYALGTAVLLKRYEDLATNLISEDGNSFALRQVREFYNEAGDGASLYLMLVPNTLTVAMMASSGNSNGARKLLEYAEGKIKVLGLMSDDAQVTVPGTDGGINDDVFDACTYMQVMAETFRELQMPFRCIIGGSSFTGVAADLQDITTGAINNRSAVLVGDTQASKNAALGLVLGRASRVSLEEKLSFVGRGPLMGVTAAWYGRTSTVESLPYDWETIQEAGYMTLRKRARKTGYYLTGDEMATASSDDYHFFPRGRVIDKAQVLAYDALVDYVDGKVPTVGGKIDPGFALAVEKALEQLITTTMISTGEVTDVKAYIDLDQDILADSEFDVSLGITPYGYSSMINVVLGYKK